MIETSAQAALVLIVNPWSPSSGPASFSAIFGVSSVDLKEFPESSMAVYTNGFLPTGRIGCWSPCTTESVWRYRADFKIRCIVAVRQAIFHVSLPIDRLAKWNLDTTGRKDAIWLVRLGIEGDATPESIAQIISSMHHIVSLMNTAER